MRNTGMVGKLGLLAVLVACHTSSPSVTSGSGSSEPVAPTAVERQDPPLQPQNDAPAVEHPSGTGVPGAVPVGNQVGSAPVSPPPSHPATTGSATTGTAAPGMGEKCGAGDACATGLACVSYYGIAGRRGGEFKSCEVRCDKDAQCPSSKHCVTVSDGPGRVCR